MDLQSHPGLCFVVHAQYIIAGCDHAIGELRRSCFCDAFSEINKLLVPQQKVGKFFDIRNIFLIGNPEVFIKSLLLVFQYITLDVILAPTRSIGAISLERKLNPGLPNPN